MARLKRILHIAHGITSYDNSLVELATQISGSGVEFITASHNDLSSLLNAENLPYIQLEDDVVKGAKRRTALDSVVGGRLSRTIQRLRIRLHHRASSLVNTEVQELIERLQPDLLLVDMECHKAIILAYNQRVPIVLLNCLFTVFNEAGNPPLHSGMYRPKNKIDRLYVKWLWLKLWLYKLKINIAYMLSARPLRLISYKTNSRSEIRQLARSRGISLDNITNKNHWLIPHVYSQLPYMSLTAKELDFVDDTRSTMHYVGPMIGSKNVRRASNDQGEDLLNVFLEKRRACDNPIVYCSFSTFFLTGISGFLPLLNIFKRRSDLDLVLGLGGKGNTHSFEDVPENILLLEYAPQIEVIKQASVVITHGGISTINESLYYGVPLLVCCGGHVDQKGNAARVVHHGVGINCNTSPINEYELERSIDFLLSEEGKPVRRNVKNIQATLRKYKNTNAAFRFLQCVFDESLKNREKVD